MRFIIPNPIIKSLHGKLVIALESKDTSEETKLLIEHQHTIENWLKKTERYGYSRDETAEIKSGDFALDLVPIFYDIIKNIRDVKGKNKLKSQIESYVNLMDNPSGAVVKDLSILPDALFEYISLHKDHWLYTEDSAGHMHPLVAVNSVYAEAENRDNYYTPAQVTLDISYSNLGSSSGKNATFYIQDLKGGVTCQELLNKAGLYLGNENLDEVYFEELKRYNKYKKQIGAQFSGVGVGSESDDGSHRWHRSGLTSLLHDGYPTKLVVDVHDGYAKIADITSKWRKRVNDKAFKLDKDFITEGEHVAPPPSTYLHMFSLKEHSFYLVHVNDIMPYEWDPSLKDKLVLPEKHKSLIDVLTLGTEDIMDDIVKGKTGGIIVVATGLPGVGKTLTAEVYSEVVKKPLYIVQASQLGIDPERLEKNLNKVLERATRWSAILLIDECDVYVRNRGNDISQNAIVGVFLRVLEYYRGILFMTSNRGTIIDDAILSRATAHIRYVSPDMDAKVKIWKILVDQFKLDMEDNLISECLVEIPKLQLVTGRDIKSILKLAGLLSKRQKTEITREMIEYSIEFQDINLLGEEDK